MFYHSFQKRGVTTRSGANHIIVTLDANKFAEKKQPSLHIGNLQSFKVSVALHNQSGLVVAPRLYYDDTSKTHIEYPPKTKAFLYYFASPKNPRIAGELRLRVTPNDDPAYFDKGFDLLRLNGHQVWSRPLYSLSKFYLPLYEKLREEGFVPDDLDAVLSTFSTRLTRSQILYTLNDTFIVDFSRYSLFFTVITERGMEMLRFREPFVECREIYKSAPYRGTYTNLRLSILLD